MNRTQVCAEARGSKDRRASAEARGGKDRRASAEARGGKDLHVEIRQACSGDRDAIAQFLAGLSLRTRYLRFFTGGAPVSGAMLGILTGSRDRADAIVATENGTIIGHAMAIDTAGPVAGAHIVEIGVVVADARQGDGVGSALVREVTARAQTRGATTVLMEVLAENRQVLAMIVRRWPAACHTRSGPYVTVRAEMTGGARQPSPGRRAGKEAGRLEPVNQDPRRPAMTRA